jgi:ubiquinone/menaquinone biosynthesis C-methylase UbiE
MTKYTHGHHEAVLRSHRWRTAANSAAYLLPHLEPSMHILDIGAGPGTITADLAGLVDTVTSTEITDEALALSREHIASRSLTNVTFDVQDVHRLTYPDSSFDVVHAHQVLQHVEDPVGALTEMRRVTKTGGIVAARDSDYAAFAWYPLLPELDDWLQLYRSVARANGGEPDAGRHLAAWARQAGFEQIEATSSTWCFATPEDSRWWGGLWADRMTESEIARQLVDSGLATTEDLSSIAEGWRTWAQHDDAWFSVLHGEVLCRA